ncbi:MAG: SRPBCC family protein [Gemmatimonadetes bacterium]|nr:SRPBCC family protein [Gemmatimonadota bacterium]
MHVYRLKRTQILPVSLDVAWDFLCRPEHLQDLTPPGVGLTVTSELPDRMYPGLIITYRLGLYSMFYFNWVTEITQAEPLRYFIDEQRSGPYKFWHHEHRLRSVEGGVEMKDLIHYALPFGVLGRMVHAAIVKNRLNAIFDYRREALADRFGQPVR